VKYLSRRGRHRPDLAADARKTVR